jgi:glycosyltransferase involved in cell wall biosynthesis
VVLEALACGLPVIVSANTGSKEMVRDGEDGFVVPIRDVEALKQKILLLYEDPHTQQKMAQAAAQRASQFTWDGYARRALQMYERLGGMTPKNMGVA